MDRTIGPKPIGLVIPFWKPPSVSKSKDCTCGCVGVNKWIVIAACAPTPTHPAVSQQLLAKKC